MKRSQEQDPNRFYGLNYEQYSALTPVERKRHIVKFERDKAKARREQSIARQAEIEKAEAERIAARKTEEAAKQREAQERAKAVAKRAYFAASPAATEQEFETSYAAMMQRQGEDLLIEHKRRLRGSVRHRIGRGI